MVDRACGKLCQPGWNRAHRLLDCRGPSPSSLTEVRQALTDADVAASIRAGQIRVSFHLYNTLDELDHVAATVARLI
jgi:selenocysteine lyase/cysteine desulfurase